MSRDATVRDLIRTIDTNGIGVALVISTPFRLLATLTDGDLRRGLLSGVPLDASVQTLLDHASRRTGPLTAPRGMSMGEILKLMKRSGVRQVPIVDEGGEIVDIAVLDELVKERSIPVSAIVMAGGYGARLRPLTDDVPKPMLPVGGRPILEVLLDQLRQAGVVRIYMSTHYKREMIESHFGDGRRFGVEIRYLPEEHPRGTAGALRALRGCEEILLMVNGDIVTRADLRALIRFHMEHAAGMTIGLREFRWRIPYGVVSIDGIDVTGLEEKPAVTHFISAGLYVLSPEVLSHMPDDQAFDMPELVTRSIRAGIRVVGFAVHEYWLDIGRLEDYQRANEELGGETGQRREPR